MSIMRMKTPLDVAASDHPDIIDLGWMRLITTSYSRLFWEGCQNHELRIPKCRHCGHVWFYPTPRCVECLEPAGDWIVSSGDATLYSYTAVHRPLHQDLAGDVPYIVAVVELSEGVRMMTNIVGAKEDELEVGMPLKVEFVPKGDAVLPLFRRA